jgi:leucyl/phenylalanyl-tRNA--protein transferase
MPVYLLSDDYIFPPIHLAEPDGLLAIGGDLSPERLIKAYASGIFPWFAPGDPILWYSPNPRLVLFPEAFKLSHSLRQVIRSGKFRVCFDQDFQAVIRNCATRPRPGQEGTWITEEMESAYIQLHHMGVAHSVEVYLEDQLAGGLYGLSLGKAFFGESMFWCVRDASKVALYFLVRQLIRWDFHLIDAQQSTSHLISLGAIELPRKEFLRRLKKSLIIPGHIGKWQTAAD